MLDRAPTEEQQAILEATASTKANLIINALAGTGKTSTLEMIEAVAKARPILYLVFNKKNAEEAEKRMASTTTVRTFNSLGHRIWAKQCVKRVTLDPKKSQNLFKAMIDEAPKPAREEMWAVYWQVIQGVALAKALGYIPDGKFPTARRLIKQGDFHRALEETPDDLTSDLIDALLTRSIQAAYQGSIDYNDQVYMPALFGGTFPRFPLTLIDEAQDLSPVNHAILDKLCKERTIAVGDPWQSIYGFRGARSQGMHVLSKTFSMTPHDLSVSFRCPSEIVKAVHWRVPNFKWTREGGHVESLPTLRGADVEDGATIICRNNAPAFAVAMRLLSSGRSVSVAGSDIGPKLVGLLRRLGPEDLPRSSVLGAIADWEAEKLAKDSSTAPDMAACMRVFAEHGDSLGQAISYAEHLFAQRGSIRLLTGHKAKGLEFDTVYHLDPWLVRRDKHNEQDMNLDYVISTRSRDKLFEIDSRQIRW